MLNFQLVRGIYVVNSTPSPSLMSYNILSFIIVVAISVVYLYSMLCGEGFVGFKVLEGTFHTSVKWSFQLAFHAMFASTNFLFHIVSSSLEGISNMSNSVPS